MNSTPNETNDHKLPTPGTVYSIPEGTHADLDIQDDKEEAFAHVARSWRNKYYGRS